MEYITAKQIMEVLSKLSEEDSNKHIFIDTWPEYFIKVKIDENFIMLFIPEEAQ